MLTKIKIDNYFLTVVLLIFIMSKMRKHFPRIIPFLIINYSQYVPFFVLVFFKLT